MEKRLLGRYSEGDGWIYCIVPQVKILVAILFSLSAILFSKMDFLLLLTTLILIVIKTSKISLKDFFSGIKPLLYVVLFTLFFQLIFTKGGEELVSLGYFKIYSKALENIGIVFLRFLNLVSIAFILTYTTSPIEITHGLEDIFSPLKKIGVPVKEIALILSIALRFIPVFYGEIERIKMGQASKGLDMDELTYIEKLKSYAHIMIPLLYSALKRGEELADAMEIRGYSLKNEKTRFRDYPIGRKDIGLMLSTISILIIYWIAIKNI